MRSKLRINLMHDWSCALELWWSNNFSKRLSYKIIASTGLTGSILFLLALQIGVSEPVSVFIRVICGFLGLALIAVSLGCGAWLLGDSTMMQAQIVPYWSKLSASFLRWLRQPIVPENEQARMPSPAPGPRTVSPSKQGSEDCSRS